MKDNSLIEVTTTMTTAKIFNHVSDGVVESCLYLFRETPVIHTYHNMQICQGIHFSDCTHIEPDLRLRRIKITDCGNWIITDLYSL